MESVTRHRHIGRFAWVMAWVGLVVGQLHALARHATVDGRADLEVGLTAAWSVPASELLAPLLTWAGPDLVYVTFGKVWFPVFAAFTLCAFVVARGRRPVGAEKWSWRVLLAGATIGCVGVLLEYWTQWSGRIDGEGLEARIFSAAFVLAVLGLPLIVLGATGVGLTLLLERVRPALPAVLLAAMIPLDVAIAQVTSMGSLALPVMFAFGLLGRRLASGVRADELLVTRGSSPHRPSGDPAVGSIGQVAAQKGVSREQAGSPSRRALPPRLGDRHRWDGRGLEGLGRASRPGGGRQAAPPGTRDP
jgi:hypothetical protein